MIPSIINALIVTQFVPGQEEGEGHLGAAQSNCMLILLFQKKKVVVLNEHAALGHSRDSLGQLADDDDPFCRCNSLFCLKEKSTRGSLSTFLYLESGHSGLHWTMHGHSNAPTIVRAHVSLTWFCRAAHSRRICQQISWWNAGVGVGERGNEK